MNSLNTSTWSEAGKYTKKLTSEQTTEMPTSSQKRDYKRRRKQNIEDEVEQLDGVRNVSSWKVFMKCITYSADGVSLFYFFEFLER